MFLPKAKPLPNEEILWFTKTNYTMKLYMGSFPNLSSAATIGSYGGSYYGVLYDNSWKLFMCSLLFKEITFVVMFNTQQCQNVNELNGFGKTLSMFLKTCLSCHFKKSIEERHTSFWYICILRVYIHILQV